MDSSKLNYYQNLLEDMKTSERILNDEEISELCKLISDGEWFTPDPNSINRGKLIFRVGKDEYDVLNQSEAIALQERIDKLFGSGTTRVECKFCGGACTCYTNIDCGFCTRHEWCASCGQLVCVSKITADKLCPECAAAHDHVEVE